MQRGFVIKGHWAVATMCCVPQAKSRSFEDLLRMGLNAEYGRGAEKLNSKRLPVLQVPH